MRWPRGSRGGRQRWKFLRAALGDAMEILSVEAESHFKTSTGVDREFHPSVCLNTKPSFSYHSTCFVSPHIRKSSIASSTNASMPHQPSTSHRTIISPRSNWTCGVCHSLTRTQGGTRSRITRNLAWQSSVCFYFLLAPQGHWNGKFRNSSKRFQLLLRPVARAIQWFDKRKN